MTSPNQGHTAAAGTLGADGLRDGDVITSPTLTNLVEAAHGNGILRLQDTVYGMTSRNEPNTNSPGWCNRASAFTITVHGGYMVLDGVLYSFANGPGSSITINLQNTEAYGISTSLLAQQESLYTIYAVASSSSSHSSAHIRFAGGTPVISTTGLYPPVAEIHLTNPNVAYTEKNGHAIVLAVVRCMFAPGQGADNIDIAEVNDKRVFLPTAPKYMTPVVNIAATTGASAHTVTRNTAGTGVNTDLQLKGVFGASDVEAGDFGGAHGSDRIDVSAMWVSHQNYDTPGGSGAAPGTGDADYGLGVAGGKDSGGTNTPTDVLYFSGQANANQAAATGGAMFTTRLGSKGVDIGTWTKGSSGTVAWPITANGDSVFVINTATASSVLNLVATGAFPEGHTIEVKKSGGSGTLQFNGGAVTSYQKWIYDGAAWTQLI